MKYDLFMMDLDDTLLDFRASEKLSFFSSLQALGVRDGLEELYHSYKKINAELWKLLEEGKTTQEVLRVERFRRVFGEHRIDVDSRVAGERYLNGLPESVVLIDGAVEICEWLSRHGEIGIITNGIKDVQARRIANSEIAPYIGFVCVSEECGFAKPDARIFEYSSRLARKFDKATSIMIGDRAEADILGAQNFGIDACWYNPARQPRPSHLSPKHEIRHLSELKTVLTDSQ